MHRHCFIDALWASTSLNRLKERFAVVLIHSMDFFFWIVLPFPEKKNQSHNFNFFRSIFNVHFWVFNFVNFSIYLKYVSYGFFSELCCLFPKNKLIVLQFEYNFLSKHFFKSRYFPFLDWRRLFSIWIASYLAYLCYVRVEKSDKSKCSERFRNEDVSDFAKFAKIVSQVVCRHIVGASPNKHLARHLLDVPFLQNQTKQT